MKLTKIEKRKFILFFLTLFMILLLSACGNFVERNEEVKLNDRITLVESKHYDGYRYSIIKVDGKEYFLDHKGAIVELSKRN